MDPPAAGSPAQVLAVWSIGLYALATVGLFAAMLLASWVLGERRPRAEAQPYESGFAPIGGAWIRYAPRFYLMGMMFVIFDAEALFLVTWAVAVREAGWSGLLEATFFVGVLLASLVWLWRIGALDWGSTVRRIRHPPPTRPILLHPEDAGI